MRKHGQLLLVSIELFTFSAPTLAQLATLAKLQPVETTVETE